MLVGQRVKIMAKDGDLAGVIGKKAIHLIEADERSKATKTKELWVDVGAASLDEVKSLGIRVGDPMVVDVPMVKLANDRIASRAIDNRIGAYVVLEAIRMLGEKPLWRPPGRWPRRRRRSAIRVAGPARAPSR